MKLSMTILGTKEETELFRLAVDGLEGDLPKTAILRRRMQVLFDRFVKD